MSKKKTYAIAACASLMLERDTIEYRFAFFTSKEVVERTSSIFPSGKKVSEKTIHNATYEVGNSSSDKYFRKGSEDFMAEYFCLDKDIDFSEAADLLLSDESKWSRKSDYTKEMILSALDEYMSIIQNMSFSVQAKKQQLETREAVWIATAVLAFNEYCRTESANPEQYFFRQRTIGKLASQYMTGDNCDACREMAQYACVAKAPRNTAKNNYLNKNENSTDRTRRLTYTCEYENTSPDVDSQFTVNTILGEMTLKSVIDFVDSTYTAMFGPKDDEWYERCRKTLPVYRAYQIVRARGSENPKSRETRVTTFIRDKVISDFAKKWAHGKCQLCDTTPFETPSGEPYLESHHIHWLSQGGADMPDNVVALCPTCHKKMHIVNDEKDINSLKEIIARALKNSSLS